MDQRKEGKGFVAAVTLGQKNPRTNETENVTLKPPSDVNPHQPTALEARHYSATYALHRVCNMINIHMALPPTHRSFWTSFEEMRKADIKNGKAWKYEADPFSAKREREAAQAKAQQAREAAATAAAAETRKSSSIAADSQARRGWQNVPQVDMARERRIEVEGLIRRHHQWNPAGIELMQDEKKRIAREMVGLGFRQIHAEEALDWVKDKEEALGGFDVEKSDGLVLTVLYGRVAFDPCSRRRHAAEILTGELCYWLQLSGRGLYSPARIRSKT